jgi:hypothetical protein
MIKKWIDVNGKCKENEMKNFKTNNDYMQIPIFQFAVKYLAKHGYPPQYYEEEFYKILLPKVEDAHKMPFPIADEN